MLVLTGCIGYQYRAVGGGVDYFIVDEAPSGPYYTAPYGTLKPYGALDYTWPGSGWSGSIGLGFGSYYGPGGFYSALYNPFVHASPWYSLPYRGYRHPYAYYFPRFYSPPPPRIVQRQPKQVRPSQHERRRDLSRYPSR